MLCLSDESRSDVSVGHPDLGSDIRATKDLQGHRPTTSMKNGWICRNSCDKKNHEIAHMMMTQWWFRSSYDWDLVMMSSRWSRSSDDPDLAVMIQIQWCWPSDDLDQVMIQIQWWWSRYRKEDQWWKLCQENTFLVKRECWCNCNFGMYFTCISYLL